LRLVGARALFDLHPEPAEISIVGGRIAASGGRDVDLSGCLLLPGIVDLHGDAFDRHVAPRRGMVRTPADGLPMLSSELAACGITTAYLAQFWSWEGGMRGPDFAKALAHALANWRGDVDLRMQLRVETHMIADFNAIARFVRKAGIDYVVFNDHLPHAALAREALPQRLTGAALRAKRSPEAHLRLIRTLAANAPQVPVALARLIAELPPIRLGSHDDTSATVRETYAGMGVAIAEFPLAPEAAHGAAQGGVILGAPNVVRGRSHGRGPSAIDLIGQGKCTALTSDYHYPAPLQAVQRLVAGGMALGQAWSYVSANPARLMGLSDRGKIAIGARADLVVLNADNLSLMATFAAGRPVWMHPDMATRLLR